MRGYCIKLAENNAGIENDPQFDTQFVYGELNIGGKNQKMLYLNASDAIQVGARLITPYFKMEFKKHAVFSIEYFMDGEGIKSLEIIKQDSFNSVIWMSDKKSNEWQKAIVCIEAESDPRYFIQVNCDPLGEGTVAISKIKLQYCCCVFCGDE